MRSGGGFVATYDFDGSGKARNIHIVEARPAGVFDAAAVEALRRSEFSQGAISVGCRYVADFAAVRRSVP